MTEASEKAKPGPKPKAKQVLVAIHNINGVIAPGTPFTGAAATLGELLDMGAAREPSEAEAALFEKVPGSVATISGGEPDPKAALE